MVGEVWLNGELMTKVVNFELAIYSFRHGLAKPPV
jgi:hypothetical protein